MDKSELLKAELTDNKFRSGRAYDNNAAIYKDVFNLMGVEVDAVNKYAVGDEDERGSGIFAMLLYQNILLLERVQRLEKYVYKFS